MYRHVLLVDVNGYVVAAILGLVVGIWIGVRMGGLIAVRRLAEAEFRSMASAAGLRKK
jgi:hypothetical protein